MTFVKRHEEFGWAKKEEKGLRVVGQYRLRWMLRRRGTEKTSKCPLGWKMGFYGDGSSWMGLSGGR